MPARPASPRPKSAASTLVGPTFRRSSRGSLTRSCRRSRPRAHKAPRRRGGPGSLERSPWSYQLDAENLDVFPAWPFHRRRLEAGPQEIGVVGGAPDPARPATLVLPRDGFEPLSRFGRERVLEANPPREPPDDPRTVPGSGKDRFVEPIRVDGVVHVVERIELLWPHHQRPARSVRRRLLQRHPAELETTGRFGAREEDLELGWNAGWRAALIEQHPVDAHGGCQLRTHTERRLAPRPHPPKPDDAGRPGDVGAVRDRAPDVELGRSHEPGQPPGAIPRPVV